MDLIYWGVFALAVIGYVVWILVVIFGSGPLGYTRSSTESLPTRKDGKP